MSTTWDLSGNTATNPPTDFLGTTDNQPLVVQVNREEVVRFDADGNIGLGTKHPLDPIHVARDSGRAGIRFEAANGPGYRSYSLGTAVEDWSLRLRDETGGYDLLVATWWNANIILGTPSSHVGIGVGEPADKLHVYSGTGPANVRLEANNGAGAFRAYSLGTTTNDYDLHLRDETGARDLLTASWRTGHIGVGVEEPADKLHVYSGSGPANVRLEANNGAGAFRAYSLGTTTNDYDLHLRDETGARELITASWRTGHIGVGTTPGSEELTVGGLIRTGGVKFPDNTVLTTANDARVAKLVTQVTQLGNTVTSLSNIVNGQSSRIAALEARVATLERRLNALN